MLIFTEHDRKSATWMRLEEYLLGRIEQLRKDNDHNLDAVETARLRGRIEEVKTILRSVNADREVEVDAG